MLVVRAARTASVVSNSVYSSSMVLFKKFLLLNGLLGLIVQGFYRVDLLLLLLEKVLNGFLVALGLHFKSMHPLIHCIVCRCDLIPKQGKFFPQMQGIQIGMDRMQAV